MKKIIIAVVIGLLLVAALATTALADNGPHGGFTATTDACAGCHRAHTAKGVDSLLVTDETSLCLTCHNGSGAYTNVQDGTYGTAHTGATALAGTGTNGDAGGALFGGGFSQTAIRHTWTGKGYYNENLTRPSDAVTSAHKVGGTNLTVYGSGDINSTANGATGFTLECTSCHTPHGKGGKDATTGNGVPTYRLLRYQATGSNGYEVAGGALFSLTGVTMTNAPTNVVAGTTGGLNITDPATHWYTLNDDVSKDPTLAALTAPHASATDVFVVSAWQPISTGLSDYSPASRGSQYKRPAITANAASLYCNYASVAGYGYIPDNNPPLGTVTTSNNGCASVVTAAASNPSTKFDNSGPRYEIALFCAECHDRYLANSGSRSADSGDNNFMFRHASGSVSSGRVSVTCVDCHVAHGTSSTETSLSGKATLASDQTSPATIAASSALLKLDNRSMCARCHYGTIGVALDMTHP